MSEWLKVLLLDIWVDRQYCTFSFCRPTFQVKSKTDASNAAYTSGRLPLHTDLAYYIWAPGVSFAYKTKAAKKKCLVALHRPTPMCRIDPFKSPQSNFPQNCFSLKCQSIKLTLKMEEKNVLFFIKYSWQALLLCNKPFDH